jgi:hypothetical protein
MSKDRTDFLKEVLVDRTDFPKEVLRGLTAVL